MNDWRAVRTAMVAVLLAATVLLPVTVAMTLTVPVTAASSRLDTYTFTDEITGLAIDLPRGWERRDLRRMGATLSPAADEYHRRRRDSPVLGELILIALATPYSGPPQNQPAIVCAANVASRSVNLEFVKTTLQNSVDMAFGRLERDAEMSQPVKVKVSGHDAYRMSVRNVDGQAMGADFIAMPRGERLLHCFGVHDETHREEITAVLGSMRIEKVKTPTTKDAMQTVYARFGCDVTTFDILMAASDRRSGLSRKDAMNVRAGVVFKNRSSLYGISEKEFRRYAGQVLDDAYGHPALDDAGLAAYQTYKCERLIAGQKVEPLARFEKALINCGTAEDPKSCRADILAAGGSGGRTPGSN